MLDAHPDLAVAHESRFLAWMACHRRRYEGHGFSTSRFLSDLLDRPSPVPSRLHTWGLDPDMLRAAVAQAGPQNLGEAIRSLYRLYSDARGKLRYGDKTPSYLEHLPELGELLPEARFVHLVRDGRDVALSMLDVDFGANNLSHAAWLWSRRIRGAQRAGTTLGESRYVVVRYEDLIEHPEAVLRRICGFLALPFDTAMLRYHQRSDRVRAGLGDQPHHQHLELPITRGLRDWRSQMSSAEAARFGRLAGDVLEALGYDVDRPGPPRRGPTPLWTQPRAAVDVIHGRAVAAVRARRRAAARR